MKIPKFWLGSKAGNSFVVNGVDIFKNSNLPLNKDFKLISDFILPKSVVFKPEVVSGDRVLDNFALPLG